MKLENSRYVVQFIPRSAQCIHFIDKLSGYDIIWSGDSKYWANHNPILFPMIGNTYSKKYMINGLEYSFGNHGVIRHMDFDLVSQNDDSLILQVKANDWSKEQYPFNFTMNVKYTLADNTLLIDYEIINNDEKDMPFIFGLHPAFAIDEDVSNYHLQFEKKEILTQLLNENIQLEDKVITENIDLSEEIFEKYPTLIYKDMVSDYVQLVSDKHNIEVGIKGYPYLAFWKKEEARFVCIEPWCGLGDSSEHHYDFYERPNMTILKANENYRTSYYIKYNK
ncbi:MAG: aldose 1-epimerase family protein [Erysipelotrichaceae bacterium]